MTTRTGRHFLQIPGPSNVPDRILHAMAMPTIDHRGPEFAALGRDILSRLPAVFQTQSPVIVFPSSGTGAWEAAIVNLLEPGDQVLMFETGQFSSLWHAMAVKLGIQPQLVPGDWRTGADPDQVGDLLKADTAQCIKAVMVVHNETSTGVTSRIGAIREAMDAARHPALLLVDTISSLGSIDYRMDEWQVDVTVCGSQKGLMLPPGLGFNAVSERALAAAEQCGAKRSYWDWHEMLKANETGNFPYTPATNLLFGLRESLDMLFEEGLENVFARHQRHAEATRRAVAEWGLEVLARNPAEFSSVLTAVMMPEAHSADALRQLILERFDMSLGSGLGQLADRVFRIGHLGYFNDLMLAGTLSGVEMGLALSGLLTERGTNGVSAALNYLAGSAVGYEAGARHVPVAV